MPLGIWSGGFPPPPVYATGQTKLRDRNRNATRPSEAGPLLKGLVRFYPASKSKTFSGRTSSKPFGFNPRRRRSNSRLPLPSLPLVTDRRAITASSWSRRRSHRDIIRLSNDRAKSVSTILIEYKRATNH